MAMALDAGELTPQKRDYSVKRDNARTRKLRKISKRSRNYNRMKGKGKR